MRYLIIVLVIVFSSCASKKYKSVSYLETSNAGAPKLNLFVPRSKSASKPVLIFVHGGNWDSGNKNQYGFFGRNFAKKNIITIIPDYTLSPDANYETMTVQIAAVINWAKKHAADYGGDPNQIFVTGHSAGGHLGALAVMNPKFGINPGAVSGIILNDAAGLDMKYYLEENPPQGNYKTTWTTDSAKWRDASPIYYINQKTPPMLLYVGAKTYPSIKVANEQFLAALQPVQPNVELITLNKRHIPMVLQYFFPWNDRFDEIAAFISENKTSN